MVDRSSRAVDACAAVHEDRLREGLVGAPDLVEMLLGQRWMLMIPCRHVFDNESRRAVVRQQAVRQIVVEMQLVIRQKTDDRADARRLDLFQPGVNVSAWDGPATFAGVSGSASPRELRNGIRRDRALRWLPLVDENADRVSAYEQCSRDGLPLQNPLHIAFLEPGGLGFKMTDQVREPIGVDILRIGVAKREARLIPRPPERQRTSVDRGGRVKTGARQDGHRNIPMAPRVDAARNAVGLDVDRYADRRWCRDELHDDSKRVLKPDGRGNVLVTVDA